MEVELQSPGGLQRVVRVSVPAERYGNAVTRRLRQIGQRARIPGFRPGKAPLKVIEQQYGDQARADAITDLVRETWPEALQKVDVNPAGAPSFEIDEQNDSALVYNASFEVYPDIQLGDFSQLALERISAEVTDADVDDLVENLRKAKRKQEAVTRPAQDGDVVVIDFAGTIDGEAFEGGSAEQSELELGAGQFLRELEEGLIGHAAGEEFEVPVTFPEDYQAEDLRGKQASFAVTMREVREVSLPEIDEAFLKDHKVDPADGVDGLRAKCRTALEKEQRKATRTKLKQAVLDATLAMHQFEVPQNMVAQEIGRLRDEMLARFNATQLSDEQKQQMVPDDMLQPQAQKRVALGLLLGEIIKQHKIELEESRLEAMLDDLAADYEQPEQVKQHYRSNPQMLQGIRAMTIEEQVVDHLLESAKITDKTVPLQELLNERRGQ